MGKPYSMDLRERAVAAVVRAGCPATKRGAIWLGCEHGHSMVRRWRETGSVAPGQMGGTS